MQKILMVFVFLYTIFTIGYAQDTNKRGIDARIFQVDKNAKITNLTKSPDGKWKVFVKKSNYIIPSNCFYFSQKGEKAKEIWIVNTKEMTKKLLVASHFNCRDVSKVIIDPHNLQFSPNSKTLYFETSAWVTSGAIHAVDVDGNHLRFVTPGNRFRVVQSGKYKKAISL